MKQLLFSVLLCLVYMYSSAQTTQYNWGKNEQLAYEKWKFMSFLIKTKQWEDAKKPLTYLLTTTPDLNPSLYIKGTKIYKNLQKEEENKELKQIYRDSVITLYNKRIEIYGATDDLLNRKGNYLWRYKSKTANDEEMYNMYLFYKNFIDRGYEKTYEYVYYSYFLSASKALYLEKITKEEYLTLYYNLEDKIVKDKYKKKKLDIFKSLIKVDKELITSFYLPKYKENPDTNTAKLILSISSKEKIYDEYLIEISEYLYKNTSNPTYYLTSADIYYNLKKYNKAVEFYLIALDLVKDDSEKKANISYNISLMYYITNNYIKSRIYALKSLKYNPNLKEAHNIIGDLYYNNYQTYIKQGDTFTHWIVFCCAYDEYKLAGNTKMMSECKTYFPSMEAIFLRGYNKGDLYHLDGWINRDTHLYTN